MNVPKIELTKNYSISRIIKGGWQLAGGHGFIDRQAAIDDMFVFVEAGITTFDFGDIYTGVEEMVGNFRRQYIQKFGKERAKDLQLHTKFVPDLDKLVSITKKDVQKGIDRSLKRLGVERLDLVQYHWWDYDVPRYVEIASYLQELKKMGKIRYIGVTNFDAQRLSEILDAGVDVTSSQNQYSVLDPRPVHGLIEFCRMHNIQLLCYGTVAGGFLSERYVGVKEPQPPYENRSLTKYKLIIDDFGGWDLFQELLRVLEKIAKKHTVSITNVATRYVLDKQQVAGVIIGARSARHIEDNVRVFTFKLDREDSAVIERVIKKAKGPLGDVYSLERIKGGKHAGIMKYNLNKK